ncbi:MAG: YceD family protein [Acidiferrobacter sp.]
MLWNPWGEPADPERLAAQAADFDGVLASTSLTRLATLVQSMPDVVEVTLHFDSDGHSRPRLTLRARADVVVCCQRCGEALAYALESRAQLVFVRSPDDEQTLTQGGSDAYYIDGALMLASVVEDELILSLPMAPTHTDRCRPAVAASTTPHPFAALAGLFECDH